MQYLCIKEKVYGLADNKNYITANNKMTPLKCIKCKKEYTGKVCSCGSYIFKVFEKCKVPIKAR